MNACWAVPGKPGEEAENGEVSCRGRGVGCEHSWQDQLQTGGETPQPLVTSEVGRPAQPEFGPVKGWLKQVFSE